MCQIFEKTRGDFRRFSNDVKTTPLFGGEIIAADENSELYKGLLSLIIVEKKMFFILSNLFQSKTLIVNG